MYIYICICIYIYMYIYIYICIYIYNYVYIIEVNYAINRIHEKAFRSDLSTKIKKTFLLTNY